MVSNGKLEFHTYALIITGIAFVIYHILHLVEITHVYSFPPLAWLILYACLAGWVFVTLGIMIYSAHRVVRRSAIDWRSYDLKWLFYGTWAFLHTSVCTLVLAAYYVRYSGIGPDSQNPFDTTASLQRGLDWYSFHYVLGFYMILLDLFLPVLLGLQT